MDTGVHSILIAYQFRSHFKVDNEIECKNIQMLFKYIFLLFLNFLNLF